eukprot:TRINITY_DN5247_c0_g1_i1.p1 TRINITY_DN5247_c0_g1~~TRINITY_DN5247_c0_g1_i1.p1  ORF type:complete len:997 (+),score=236.54 TRINITY_DN5247_c0_g1_i1:174-3164(+)
MLQIDDVICVVGDYHDEDEPHDYPIKIPNLPQNLKVKKMVMGNQYSILLTMMGTAFSWGANMYGQLALGHTNFVSEPTLVSGFEAGWIDLSVGSSHSVFISRTGKLYSCGDNEHGKLGLGDGEQQALEPRKINIVVAGKELDIRFQQVCCGHNHTLALSVRCTGPESGEPHPKGTSSGSDVFSFGEGRSGKLGIGQDIDQCSPVLVVVGSERSRHIRQIGCGKDFSAAVSYDGNLFTWGKNIQGQLGHGDFQNRWRPEEVMNLKSEALNVQCGDMHVAVLDVFGDCHLWGDNGFGQCGTQNITETFPRQVEKLSLRNERVKSMACGKNHTILLGEKGTVFGAGSSDSHQLAIPETLYEVTPIPTLKMNDQLQVSSIFCAENATFLFGILTENNQKDETEGNLNESKGNLVSETKSAISSISISFGGTNGKNNTGKDKAIPTPNLKPLPIQRPSSPLVGDSITTHDSKLILHLEDSEKQDEIPSTYNRFFDIISNHYWPQCLAENDKKRPESARASSTQKSKLSTNSESVAIVGNGSTSARGTSKSDLLRRRHKGRALFQSLDTMIEQDFKDKLYEKSRKAPTLVAGQLSRPRAPSGKPTRRGFSFTREPRFLLTSNRAPSPATEAANNRHEHDLPVRPATQRNRARAYSRDSNTSRRRYHPRAKSPLIAGNPNKTEYRLPTFGKNELLEIPFEEASMMSLNEYIRQNPRPKAQVGFGTSNRSELVGQDLVSPGPANYYPYFEGVIENKGSSFSKSNRSEMVTSTAPGVGSYNINQATNKKTTNRISQPTLSRRRPSKQEKRPGPGTYNIPPPVSTKSFFTGNNNFGSAHAEPGSSSIASPGPATYNVRESLKANAPSFKGKLSIGGITSNKIPETEPGVFFGHQDYEIPGHNFPPTPTKNVSALPKANRNTEMAKVGADSLPAPGDYRPPTSFKKPHKGKVRPSFGTAIKPVNAATRTYDNEAALYAKRIRELRKQRLQFHLKNSSPAIRSRLSAK